MEDSLNGRYIKIRLFGRGDIEEPYTRISLHTEKQECQNKNELCFEFCSLILHIVKLLKVAKKSLIFSTL
jgi:hypothetical protein